jgi:hypothetical protein
VNFYARIPALLPLALERFGAWIGILPAGRWIDRAGDDELVFAGYNDAISYGQLIVVREGRIVRDELADMGADQRTLLLYGPAGDFMAARSDEA